MFSELTKIIKFRKDEKLFHPNVPMEVEDFGDSIFAFRRINNKGESLLVLNNLTNETVAVTLPGSFINLILQEKMEIENELNLHPYEFLWLKTNLKEEKND